MVTSSANARVNESTHGAWLPEFTFGDHLRRVRRSLDMGQREFAEKLQQKLGTYQLWEADISKPRDMVAVAKRVEILTGVSAAWILGLESTAPQPGAPAAAVGDVQRARRDSNPQPSDPGTAPVHSRPKVVSLDARRDAKRIAASAAVVSASAVGA